jgi:hypothetical protein
MRFLNVISYKNPSKKTHQNNNKKTQKFPSFQAKQTDNLRRLLIIKTHQKKKKKINLLDS